MRGIDAKPQSTSRKSSQGSLEPPLPPIVDDVRPWGAEKFSAGFPSVSGPLGATVPAAVVGG